MSVTSGFFNSSGGDRKYNAEQIAQMFDGFITDGIVSTIGTTMTVKAAGGLKITVGIGRAWFNHTWTLNDALLPLTAEASDVLRDRIDAVVLEVNKSESVRANSIKMVTGTAAATPAKPTLTKSGDVYQYALAYISRKANSTEIVQADITNAVGTDETPFVTNVLKSVSLDELLGKWQDELDRFTLAQEENVRKFVDEQKAVVDDVAEKIAGLDTSKLAEVISVYSHKKTGNVHNFTGVGPNGRVKMTANVYKGDTVTLNGSEATAYVGPDNFVDSMAGEAVNGRWLTFTLDGTVLNFKGGGGVGSASLASATATSADVLAGKTFYSKDKTQKEGTIIDRGQYQYGKYGAGSGYVAVTLPAGYYKGDSPEARITNSDLAAGIGLIATKIVQGQQVLGISGTAVQPAIAGVLLVASRNHTEHAAKGAAYANEDYGTASSSKETATMTITRAGTYQVMVYNVGPTYGYEVPEEGTKWYDAGNVIKMKGGSINFGSEDMGAKVAIILAV